jgi:hypothetical protein
VSPARDSLARFPSYGALRLRGASALFPVELVGQMSYTAPLFGEIEMPNETMRLTAFFAVALALLYAGWSYQQGELFVSVCFMLAAIALTVVTRLTVRRQII